MQHSANISSWGRLDSFTLSGIDFRGLLLMLPGSVPDRRQVNGY
jgi:hypothetical protein